MMRSDTAEGTAEGSVVSVVVPVYNVGEYLREAMDSLLAQQYRNLDIICVNDGSADGSPAILREYAERDARIRIIDKENGGYGRAMNVGIAAAKGEWLAVFEPDDALPPEAYGRLVAATQMYDVDMVKGGYATFSTDVRQHSKCYSPLLCGEVFNPQENRAYFDGAVATWAALYRLSFLHGNKLAYHESPGASYQDIGMFFLCGAYAERICCIPDCVYYYRCNRPGSSVSLAEKKVHLLMGEHTYIRRRLEQDKPLWEKLQKDFVRRVAADMFYFFKRLDSHGERAGYLRLWQSCLEDMKSLDHSGLKPKVRRRVEAIRRNPGRYLASLEGSGNLFYRHAPGLREFRFFGLTFLSLERTPVLRRCRLFGITVSRSTTGG